MNSGPERCLEARQRREGHHVALAVAHVKLPELLGLGPVLPFRLHVNLPLAAKPVEVVDEVGAHEGLQGSVDVGQFHPLFEHLVPVHVDEDLGHGGGEGGGDAGQLRPLARLGQEFLGVLPQEGDVLCLPDPRSPWSRRLPCRSRGWPAERRQRPPPAGVSQTPGSGGP